MWLKNNKQYFKAYNHKCNAKKIHDKFPSNTSKINLSTAHTKLMEIYNKLKLKYYDQLIRNNSKDYKQFYRLMSTKRKIINVLPPIMIFNNIKYSNDLRYHFLCKQLQSNFQEPTVSFASNQEDSHNQLGDIYREYATVDQNNIWENYVNSFNISEVTDAINSLDENKDSGPMQIQAKFLKFNNATIAPILTNIFNSILETGFIPHEWKHSFITPIPKKGSSINISNYRGIAMQSCIPKLFDKLITTKIYEHVKNILPNEQHGFRPNRSTTSNLMEMTNYLHCHFNNNNQVDVIYFDYSKAFDMVDHSILATKLAKTSTPFLLYLTIMNFVINRTYQLKCNGIAHDYKFKIESSVPQDSHCGPLLFIIMTADIIKCIENTNVKMLLYADDLKIYNIVNNETSRA